MKMTVLDVGAGSCTILTWEDGNSWIFDCGKKSGEDLADTMRQMGVVHAERLIIQNEDEDHIRGFADIRNAGFVNDQTLVYRNNKFRVEDVGRAKARISGATSVAWDIWELWASTLKPADPEVILRVEGRQTECRFRVYPGEGTGPEDTNNSSMVAVLQIRESKIVLPGDMEQRGWEDLIQRYPGMLHDISNCEAFVAAHHGRESGFHNKVLAAANPGIVIVSDKKLMYGTQENMTSLYGHYARGRWVFNDRMNNRKVLTTRHDGVIRAVWDTNRDPQRSPHVLHKESSLLY